jgi:uroporphyrinogen-III decarboxylase
MHLMQLKKQNKLWGYLNMAQTGDVKKGLGAVFDTGKKDWLQMVAQCHDHTMLLAGLPANKYYFDAKLNCEAGAQVSGYYGLDSVSMGYDAYDIEIEALGGKMIYGENSMPTIDFRDPLIKKPEDLDHLRKKEVDWYNDGRFPFMLESLDLNLQYGFGTSVFCSPFSMAVGMCSFPRLIKFMRKDPKFAQEIFEYIVDDVLLPWVKIQNESSGNIMAIGADAWACIPNLSVKEMKEWVVPYNIRLMEKAIKKGVLAMNISGDYCEERMERYSKEVLHGSFDVQIASNGAPTIFLGMGRWFEYPLEDVREYTAKYRDENKMVTLSAGINARLLRDGPVEKIVDNVKRFIDAFGRDHDLTVFLANIPADTPSDHIHAAVAAAHTYGKLPIADNLDDIEFNLPKRESFKEWQKKNNLTLEW